MLPGDRVVMASPNGYETVEGRGGEFIGWIPNGIEGVIYVLTPDRDRAVVHFDGRMIATVPCASLRVRSAGAVAPVA
jgi:hypothetical protein